MPTLLRVLILTLLAAACSSSSTSTTGRALKAGGSWLLPWGDGDGRVGLLAAEREFLPQGPSSVAVAPGGEVLILDRLHGRVLAVRPGGTVEVASLVPQDSEDLAVGPDGTLATWSPSRHRAWLFDRSHPLGELAIPEGIREARGIGLGPSRRVLIHSSFQETFVAGSPAMPQLPAAVLASRLPGELQLPDGTGLAVLAADRRLVLLRLRPDAREDTAVRVPLQEHADAARLVGTEGATACLRLETLVPGPAISVTRRLACVDSGTGETLLSQELPAPGLFVPRRELAVGAGRVALILPGRDGLQVTSFALPAGRTP